MPSTWTFVTYTSAFAFLIAGLLSRRKSPWLAAYLLCCVPACVIWAREEWCLSRDVRPIVLGFQAMAVIEGICTLHVNCWRPRQRYLFAGFCGLCAIGGTYAAVEYPGYPSVLWWVQLWLEVGGAVSCGAALALFRWWEEFRPAGWAIGSLITLTVYCAVEAIALLWPSTQDNWVAVDVTMALMQDCCLLWWCVLYSGDS